MPKFQDLTGQRFHKLLVLEYIKKPKGKSKWKCQCDCGNIIYLPNSNLRSGQKSCGCIKHERRIDLTNKRFGRLLVIKFVGRIKKHSIWECKCDCGKIIKVSYSRLTKGETKSCKCLQSELMKKRMFIDYTPIVI